MPVQIKSSATHECHRGHFTCKWNKERMQTIAYHQLVNAGFCWQLFRPAVGVLIIKLGKPSKLHEPASGRHPYSYKVGLTCI